MVEETFACGQHDVVNAGLDYLRKRAVSLDVELQVGAVAAHHVHQSVGQLIAFHFVNPALDSLYYLGFLETVDVVPDNQEVLS